MVATRFENVHEADKITLHISLRIGQRIAHARLGREVNHHIESVLLEQAVQRSGIDKIGMDELEGRASPKHIEPGMFQTHIVIVIEVVEADDRATRIEIALREMEADEARGACNEDRSHSSLAIERCRRVTRLGVSASLEFGQAVAEP